MTSNSLITNPVITNLATANPVGKSIPRTDEERRKQADTRRPMLFRKMLVFDMDEKIDLDDLLRKQLNRERANGSQ